MGARENTPSSTPDMKVYLLIIVVVSLVVIALASFRWLMGSPTPVPLQSIAAPTPIVVERGSSPNMDVLTRQVDMYCMDDGMVDYSIFDLIVSGGFRPYEFRLENMLYQVLGPFPLQQEGEPIRLKVYGGESVLVKIWSYGSTNPDWTGMISVPLKDPFCEGTSTSVASSTFTATLTSTPTPTARLVMAATGTPSRPPKEPSVVPAIVTPTSVVNPSATSAIYLSSTPDHEPSNTPVSASITPVIVPSGTPVVVPSDTEKPTDMPTPINPNPKECEDGKDNDGDGFTDYPMDPQCGRPGDPHEDK